jgi:hypothetical protein
MLGPHTHAEGPDAGLTAAASPRFEHDFSQIPIHPPAAGTIQAKLAISSPGDAYEREADEVADKVVRMAESAPVHPSPDAIRRKCAACEEEENTIQTQPRSSVSGGPALDPGAAVRAAQRGGVPLPSDVRSYFEPRFGYDFSRVRVHADGDAADGARAVRARAYTIGRDIVFGASEYAPATTEGRRLLAHELTHVVQQGPGASPAAISRQKAGPDETSTHPPGTKRSPRDLKKLLKDPCFGERVDDAKSRCQFSKEQSIMVKIVKEHAVRKCARAIEAINMPGNEDEVRKIATDYFHLNVKLTEKTKRTFIKNIKAVSDKLEHPIIECGTCQDEGCNRGFVAYAEAKTSLVLCPPFFASDINPVSSTPRFLIHEAGHLAGLNTPTRDELYCHQEATKEDKCPVVDAIHNVDAWSHFIEELSYTV